MLWDRFFRQAHELKKQLHEVMDWRGPVTMRQSEAWERWFDAQLNRPSLTDHYLMQLSWQLACMFAKDPAKIKMADMRLKFVSQKELEQLKEEETEAKADLTKAMFMGLLGMDQEGNVVDPRKQKKQELRPSAEETEDVEDGQRTGRSKSKLSIEED